MPNGIVGFFIDKGLFLMAALAWLFVLFFFIKKRMFPRVRIMWVLVSIMTGAYLAYALSLSALQYYTWNSNVESRYFLPPHTPISYFLGYVWLHFWYAGVVAILISFIAGGVFLFLNRAYDERFMERNEIPLIILGGLIAGWPSFVIYIAGALLLGVFGLIYARAAMGASRVNLAVPFLFAAGAALFFGNYIAPFIQLDKLIVVGS